MQQTRAFNLGQIIILYKRKSKQNKSEYYKMTKHPNRNICDMINIFRMFNNN